MLFFFTVPLSIIATSGSDFQPRSGSVGSILLKLRWSRALDTTAHLTGRRLFTLKPLFWHSTAPPPVNKPSASRPRGLCPGEGAAVPRVSLCGHKIGMGRLIPNSPVHTAFRYVQVLDNRRLARTPPLPKSPVIDSACSYQDQSPGYWLARQHPITAHRARRCFLPVVGTRSATLHRPLRTCCRSCATETTRCATNRRPMERLARLAQTRLAAQVSNSSWIEEMPDKIPRCQRPGTALHRCQTTDPLLPCWKCHRWAHTRAPPARSKGHRMQLAGVCY